MFENFTKIRLYVKEYRVILAVCLIGILLSIASTLFYGFKPLAVSVPGELGLDYNSLYFASQRVVSKDNLYYANNQTIKFMEERVGDYVYPPMLASLITPFSVFSFTNSYYIFTVFSIVLFVLSLLMLSRCVKGSRKYFLTFLVLYCFSPILLMHLGRGQTDIIILFLIVLSYVCYASQRKMSAGFFIATAATLKLSPIIFLPYFYIKDKKIFLYSIIFLFFDIILFTRATWLDFFNKILNFSQGVSSGVTSNSLSGIFFNDFTRNFISINGARVICVVTIALLVMGFFILLFKQKQIDRPSKQITIVEYAVLTCVMMITPPVSWIYNGVYFIFALTVYWIIRSSKQLSDRFVLLFDVLAFLVLSQPLLFSFIRDIHMYHIFSLRPLYILCFVGLFIFFLSGNRKAIFDEYSAC